MEINKIRTSLHIEHAYRHRHKKRQNKTKWKRKEEKEKEKVRAKEKKEKPHSTSILELHSSTQSYQKPCCELYSVHSSVFSLLIPSNFWPTPYLFLYQSYQQSYPHLNSSLFKSLFTTSPN